MSALPQRLSLTSLDTIPALFDAHHRPLVEHLTGVAETLLAEASHDSARVAADMGARHGLYPYLVPEKHGGAAVNAPDAATHVDVRALVLIRDVLGYASPLADAIFAVQGLGSYPIVLAGTDAQRERYLPAVIRGERIAGFGLTEPEAGSDVASMRCEARPDGDGWVLEGDKHFISNVPIAHHHVVFAKVAGDEETLRRIGAPEDPRRRITAFVVESDTPGLEQQSQQLSIHHPIGALRFRGCRISGDARVGAIGQGFKLAMQTLDTFRISVGAAANGMATAALDDAIAFVKGREQFGKPLSAQQMIQGYLADMATELDAARLLVARAAHQKDTTGGRASTEVAMAKMFATEAAQRIVDKAVQLHGGRGVLTETRVENLYRDIRPLRIYEGTTEIQRIIIARALLEDR